MASIFTFDPDPPRVSSPWATPLPEGSQRPSGSCAAFKRPGTGKHNGSQEEEATAQPVLSMPRYTNLGRLEAEPQQGPTEYKLHLLLRRRRSFIHATTGPHTPGSMRRGDSSRNLSTSSFLSSPPPAPAPAPPPPPQASLQSKQHHRLEQLTTQLLWRLQQSCPNHMTSSTPPPSRLLSHDTRLTTRLPLELLEESKGALYEIGVADDGTMLGLAQDEMDESLNNLRAMAATLRCAVHVLRMVPVGECAWLERAGLPEQEVRTSPLLVAEALVRPERYAVHLLQAAGDRGGRKVELESRGGGGMTSASLPDVRTMPEQLRVSVTGATMSGKSSLLGTLSTATRDNGRGKSRLSLLKHRHEIVSGMTSSLTQELIGYCDGTEEESMLSTQVINYRLAHVASWTDMHAAVDQAHHGRLVLLSDSAGHPRFRRTTVRGIVGWQPHWTLLCVPADTDASSSTDPTSPAPQEPLASLATPLDVSEAHIRLCLNLELPLVIAVTKYDLATKSSLRQTLSRLLSALKDAGRRPCIISDLAASVPETDMQSLSMHDLQAAEGMVQLLETSHLTAVPILLTSAVKGTGITKLHAFLRTLPLPAPVPFLSTTSSPLFHVEDVYSLHSSGQAAVVGGYLRRGMLSIDDELLLGPYVVDPGSDDSDSGSARIFRKNAASLSSVPNFSNEDGLSSSHRRHHSEWRRVRVVSLRNLRLPVRILSADQVGTVGIAPVTTPILSPAISRIRKGMVLAVQELTASKIVRVRFQGAQAQAVQGLSVGSAVVVYVASVRASSRVTSIATGATQVDGSEDKDDSALGTHQDQEGSRSKIPTATVSFQFIASREFVETGAKALIMPASSISSGGGGKGAEGAKGCAGLEGFVGRVL